MKPIGYTGVVCIVVGVLALPVSVMLVLHSDAETRALATLVDMALPAAFIAVGALLAFVGRKRR